MGDRKEQGMNRYDQLTYMSYCRSKTKDGQLGLSLSRDGKQSNKVEPSRECGRATFDGDKRTKRTRPAIIVCSLLFVLLFGSLALGGVALYYAYFDTPTDTYQVYMLLQDPSVKMGMTLPKEAGYHKMDRKFCKWMTDIFGGELRFCELGFLFRAKGYGVVTGGRLHFYRKKLESAAIDDTNLAYINTRLTYGRFTEYICSSVSVAQLMTRESYNLTCDLSNATPTVGSRNDPNYYAAEESVCNAIKSALRSVHMTCYVTSFETSGGRTSIHVEVYANELRDELHKDPVMLKSLARAEATLTSILQRLVNKGKEKLKFFNNAVLKVKVEETHRFG